MTAYPIPEGAVPPCRRKPDLFFPAPGRNDQAEAARHICGGCEFRDPCAAYAITRDVFGVWGKTTERERKEIRRARGIVPVPLSLSEASGIRRSNFTREPRKHPGHGTWGAIGRHERAGERMCTECREFRAAYRKAKRDANRPERPDSCALRACPDCGREMRPKSLSRHIRNVHRAAS